MTVKLELNSPDQAVKTWWKARDSTLSYDSDKCEERAKKFLSSEGMTAARNMSTGDARQNFEPRQMCGVNTYSREITEVKVESETRAIVLAKIKATTPIPAGATPDADDLKRRAEGQAYKYLVEKVGNEWKVAQVYSHTTYGDEPWQAEYGDRKPYIHAMVLDRQ